MKIKRRILAMLLVLIMCVSTLATTAFAYAEDQDPESESTSQETTAPEEEEEIPPVQTTPPVVAEEGSGFSEDGNLITRDLLFDKNTNKQFITVETKNGKIFYIIIDYDKPLDESGERFETFFLNQVDETDMKALLEDAGVVLACSCAERCIAGAVNMACDLCTISLRDCVGIVPETIPLPTEPVPTVPSEPDVPVNSTQKELMIAIVVVIGAIGIVAFLLISKKSSGKRTQPIDNYAEFDRFEEEEEE